MKFIPLGHNETTESRSMVLLSHEQGRGRLVPCSIAPVVGCGDEPSPPPFTMRGEKDLKATNEPGSSARILKGASTHELARACPKTIALATLSAAFLPPLCRNWPKFDKVCDKVDDKVSNSRLIGQALVTQFESPCDQIALLERIE